MTPSSGIYLHIPFCIKKCAYCDFYSTTAVELRPSFVAALCREIQLRATPQEHCDSVYLGGGTPSVLPADAIDAILDTLRQNFQLADDTEITLEVNPATCSFEQLKHLFNLGINRINIGVQSFAQAQLQFLGRCHSVKDAHSSLAAARRAGFSNLGLDLIYGLPRQTDAMWQEDLKAALAYAPEHISCYMLSYEPGTPMDHQRRQGVFAPLSETGAARLFDLTGRYLRAHGYEHYEISNFARKDPRIDLRSRHNRKYWNFADYFGFGPAAHSYAAGQRTQNVRNVEAYIKKLSENRLPVAATESPTAAQQRIEALYLGLRQFKGIDLAAFEERFGEDPVHANPSLLRRLQKEKMALYDGATLSLTLKGMRYLDSIVPLIN